MKMFDATPLFRSSVGFDRMMDLFESVNRLDQAAPTYPPYNIEKTGEYEYRISLAVAGFSESDLEIEARENTLLVAGRQGKEDDKGRHFLHRGTRRRAGVRADLPPRRSRAGRRSEPRERPAPRRAGARHPGSDETPARPDWRGDRTQGHRRRRRIGRQTINRRAPRAPATIGQAPSGACPT